MNIRVISRKWPTTGTEVPYRNTHELTVGQHWWKDAPLGVNFSQHYVSLRASSETAEAAFTYPSDLSTGPQYLPPEAVIARELKIERPSWVVWTEVFCGKRVFMSPELFCIPETSPMKDFLDQLRDATGRPLLGGLPDVLAGFDDGRIIMREAKHVSKKYRDKWGPKQDDVARVASQLWPGKVDVAIVEWG